MADLTQQLNPYALFDPSQWANPYSNYQNSALPGASYAGMPTNYAGQPIQPTPGMTVNQTPAQPQAAPASNPGQGAINNQMLNAMASSLTPAAGGGFTNPNAAALIGNIIGARQAGMFNVPSQNPHMNNSAWEPGPVAMPQQQAAAAPSAAPAASSGGGLTPQQYMALRANPGPVPTYGATVPQSTSSAQPGTGVLQNFLANWKPATSGAGSGFQQGFSTALKGMGYS